MWARELLVMGVESVINKKKYPNYLAMLFGHVIRRKRVDIVVFRYLNDRRSFFRTLANALTEIVMVMICRLFRIKVYWIMHNVDKESIVYYPALNSLRRKVMMEFAHKIFVMDPLLKHHAMAAGARESKLDWLSFGLLPVSHYNEKGDDIGETLTRFKRGLSHNNNKVVLGICVSSSMTKFHHFLLANEFIERANRNAEGSVIGLILVGQFPKGSKFEKARRQVEGNPNILHVDKNFAVEFEEIEPQIDFFYRAVNDLSVSYSVFDAAKSGKPLFTHNYGFLPEMVSKYELGFLIPDDEKDLATWLTDKLSSWDPEPGKAFLAARTWENGARKLATI